jgi:hypothetical protein
MSLLVSGIVLATIQAVPIVSLRSPELEFPEGFSSLTALRELRDGRVMVLDGCQARVIAIDFPVKAQNRWVALARDPANTGPPSAFGRYQAIARRFSTGQTSGTWSWMATVNLENFFAGKAT